MIFQVCVDFVFDAAQCFMYFAMIAMIIARQFSDHRHQHREPASD